MELNLAGIDSLLNPADQQGKKVETPELDLSGIDDILSSSQINSDRISFQPENSDWSIARLSSIEDYFLKEFSKPLPVSNIGQGNIHNKWNYDHRSSVDIGVNPSSREGKKLVAYLKQNNIPFLAFNKAIKGVSTGPHIHVGKPSKKLSKDLEIGETEQELDLTGLEEVLQSSSASDTLAGIPELDLSNVENLQAPLDITGALDPKKIDFKVATEKVPALLEWTTRYNKPFIIAQNPNELGPIIRTVIDNPKNEKPSVRTLTDSWLNAWNPEYKILNDRFREETGGLELAIVDSRKNYKFLSNNKLEIVSRPTRGVQALFEAYKNGGLREYNATNMLINQQLVEASNRQAEIAENIKKYEKDHPYLSAFESGFQGTAQSLTQLATNIKYLGKAVATGNYYGWDSQEYIDLINQEQEEQETIAQLGGTIYNPPSFAGKIVAGAAQGITSLPVYIASGKVSPFMLPLMAYTENLHRGNREAALAALPMAILVGTGRGLGQFTDINPLGSSAPFRRISKQDLSILKDSIVKGESVSIAQLTPFERQLIHRGANALSLQFPTDEIGVSDIVANMVVGLGFPVGRSPGKVPIPKYVPPPFKPIKIKGTGLISGEGLPDLSLSLTQPRVDVPLTKFTKPILEQERDVSPVIYPSAESPDVIKYAPIRKGERDVSEPAQFIAETEKGFVATGQGQTLHLDLDTANLNLLELKRALEEKTYRVEGDDTKTVLRKQQAIKNAIEVLEKAIPEQTKEFFAQNEQVIRAALKTNYEARIGKENLIKRREESLKPNDIKLVNPETPKVENLKQTPQEIFGGKAGDHNEFTSQDKAAEIAKNFFKLTTQGSLQSSFIPYADVLSKKAQDLAYLGAFYIEDFYRRGVVPTVDLVLNKVKGTLGDYGRYISDVQAKNLFEEGMKYYQSNVADPFFSKLKMDAAEKLPNRFDVEQARNVLSVHKDEFEWTAGLDDFLRANEGKKISKQELIDIIQQGQVRVEESVAEDFTITEEQRKQLHLDLTDLNNKVYELGKIVRESDPSRKQELEQITQQRNSLVDKIEGRTNLKYSLRVYPHEKLELPGAQNSKEVKLISSTAELIPGDWLSAGTLEERIVRKTKADYKSPHWEESDVVAHYRSNDRVTTDNQRVYFGEEFQSDWVHDIREYGVKLTPAQRNQRILEINKQINAIEAYNREQEIETGQVPFSQVLQDLYLESDRLANQNSKLIEPMPFMGHNWKELVLKRFLRDAAIAKDENGNYKYDGIGWTTARQQLERYGGILEGKEFKWFKNSDGTYSFELKQTNETGFTRHHELDKISLERFAELTTPEAAQKVRDQETKLRKDHIEDPDYVDRFGASGQFSLKEAVELRKGGMDKYGDYDVAYKNIVGKIGKRFGAKYSEKVIGTDKYNEYYATQINSREAAVFDSKDNLIKTFREIDNPLYNEEAGKYAAELNKDVRKQEKIHYLEITPSMRQSLEKEGLPLFGTGGLDPLKNPEVGIRNVLTTREAFNQHRDFLIKSLDEVSTKSPDSDGTVFNSGLNPDAFIDQAKLLYRGVKDFAEFTKVLIERFGEQVKSYLQDLWIEVKGITKAFHEDERGLLNLQFRRMQTEAEKKYRASHKKQLYYDNYSIHRGIMLAQTDPYASIVYDVIRTGQRDKNSFEAHVLEDLRIANKAAIRGTEQAVADSILIGNENQRLYTDAELTAGDASIGRPALNPDQIKAYRNAYKAEHRNLDKRLQQVLFGYKERADRLNTRLSSVASGTPAHTAILSNLLDITDAINKVTAHYQYLKDTGYISLKRKGPIAAFVQDPAFPIGDKRGEVYRQFNNIKEAGIWVAEQEKILKANPADSNIYDINIPQRLRAAAARLTPAQFEDLIDSSGVNSRSPEIEQLRDEIYSRYPSKGYELKRDYVRGYDRTWQFVLESISDQTETYANSFYSKVAGEHAIKALEATGLQTSKPDLYQIMQKFIDHEISSPERTKSSQAFTAIRKGVYLFHLGFDINQLYLNAIAQPITQTYSYFARVSHNGKMLGKFEAEKYWIEGWTLAGKVAKKAITGKGNVPKEFEDIRNRLISEGVITPEFNKSLLESEVEKNVTSKLNRNWLREIEHWAGVFMRAGEKTTRTHAAAEAYLVGKNKFNLTGEELVNFMVRSIDATQTNPSRAEAPLLIRGSQNQGEIRKLLYQFNAFNHMWLENLALNAKSDFQNRRISATSRHLIPLAIMGGIAGLPLSGIAGALYTLITNKDPKDEFHKYVNNEPLLERLALYGVTGNATLSNKLVPTFPFSESIRIEDSAFDTLKETASTSAIPAFSTTGQIAKGFDDLKEGKYSRAAGQLLPFKPLRNAATVVRYKNEGIKTRKGATIVPKSKVTSSQLFFQGLGIPPSKLTEYYNERGRKERTKRIKKLRKILL